MATCSACTSQCRLEQAATDAPVDVAVIHFQGSDFNGQVAPALAELQDSGTVRIIDAALIHKESDGSVSTLELTDAAVADAFASVTGAQCEMLSDGDLDEFGEALDAGSSALVIVWENTWAASFAAAVRGSRGEVVLLERIPRDTVLQAIAALDQE